MPPMSVSNSLRNRLIGSGILAVGLLGILASPDLSETVNLVFSFVAGAAVGAGGALLITGEPLWSRTDGPT